MIRRTFSTRTRWAGLVACLTTSFVVSVFPVHADPKTASSPVEIPTYPQGPCDPSDVLGLIGKDGQLHSAPKHATLMINARIDECTVIIEKYIAALPTMAPNSVPIITQKFYPSLPALTTPTPRPTSPPECKPFDRKQLPTLVQAYAVLDYCYGWISRYVSSPAPAPSPTPQPIVFHTPPAGATSVWRKNIYILALASDAPTSAQLSLQLTNELRTRYSSAAARDLYIAERSVEYGVIAEPTWTLSQFQQQCFSDSSTAGAIVATQPGSKSASWNALLGASWTAVGFQTLVLDCEPTNTSYVNNAAYITWVSQVNTATARRYSFSLASALAILESFLVFHPTHSDTYAVATPNPLPSPPASYKTGYTTSSNQQGSGVIAAAGVAALTPLSQTSIGQGLSLDAQMAKAIQRDIITHVLPDMFDHCKWDAQSSHPTTTMTSIPTLPSADQCKWFSKKRP